MRTVTVPATRTTTATTGATTTSTTPADPHAPLSLRAAQLTLGARGFNVLSERDLHPDQTLKVLLGVRHEAGDTGNQQAFFFVGDRFIGTDAKDTSGRIVVVDQRDDAVTLAYALYRTGDAIDSPSAGSARVTYRWNGAQLTPDGPIPSSDLGAATSRR